MTPPIPSPPPLHLVLIDPPAGSAHPLLALVRRAWAPAGYWALRATRAAPARDGSARDGRDVRDARAPLVHAPIAPDTALPPTTAAPAALVRCDAFLASLPDAGQGKQAAR